jgi:hypothetical protein
MEDIKLRLGLVIGTTMYFLISNNISNEFFEIIKLYTSKKLTNSAKYERISLIKPGVNKQLSKLAKNLEHGLSRRAIKRRLKFESELVHEMLTGLEETIQNDYYKWLSEINGS